MYRFSTQIKAGGWGGGRKKSLEIITGKEMRQAATRVFDIRYSSNRTSCYPYGEQLDCSHQKQKSMQDVFWKNMQNINMKRNDNCWDLWQVRRSRTTNIKVDKCIHDYMKYKASRF